MTETLASFVGFSGANAQAAIIARARGLKRTGTVPVDMRDAVAHTVAIDARKLLESPLIDLIGEAWAKAEKLAQLRDPNDATVREAVLKEHEISLKREPALELTLSGAPTGLEFPFQLKIGLKIASAVVRVQNARIIGAALGNVRGQGSLKVFDATLAERKTSAVALPGEVTFSPGVAIG
jgi:hypothetical protein